MSEKATQKQKVKTTKELTEELKNLAESNASLSEKVK